MNKKETERSQYDAGALVEYGWRRTAVVAGIMLAVLLEILDTTIVNVALPSVQGGLGASFEDASWVVTAYLIAVIVALPLVPWFESMLGRRAYVLGAIAGFTIASAACGAAPSLGALIACRVVQGLCGGGILTVARAILRDTFPPEQLGRSQALLALGAVTGPSVGPSLGGMLTDAASWRWVFFINVLPGLIALLLLWYALRQPGRTRSSHDAAGLLLLCVGLGSLQYVLETAERDGWFGDWRICALSALALTCTAGFAAWELFVARYPIVDLRILGNRAVAVGSALSFGIGFTLFAGIVLGPQFSQNVLGFTATLSGNQVLVRAVCIAAFIPVAVIAVGRLRIQARYVIVVGFALVAWSGFLSASATTTVSQFWTFGWALAIGGFGFGLLFVPLSVSVLGSVPQSQSTKVSAMLSMFQQLGASVSTALMVTIVDRSSAERVSRLAGDVVRSRPPVALFLAHTQHGIEALRDAVLREAVAFGFADAYAASALIAILVLPIALFLPSAGAGSRASNE